MKAAEQTLQVFIFIRSGVVPKDQRVGRGVLGEPEFRPLTRDADVFEVGLFGDEVTEGHAVIVRPGHDREDPSLSTFFSEIHARGSKVVTDRIGFTYRNAIGIVSLSCMDANLLPPALERRLGVEIEPKG